MSCNVSIDLMQPKRSTEYFNKPGWAWEYLRRNPDYLPAWQKAFETFEVLTEGPGQKVVIAHNKSNPLAPWGCLFTDAPDVDAGVAAVFWEPTRFRGALSGISLSKKIGRSSACFPLRELQCPNVLLLTPGGRQHLLLLDSGRRLQLAIDGADIRAPFHFLAYAVLCEGSARTQAGTLLCLNELLHHKRIVSPHYLTDAPSPRLTFILKALDGWLARKPHKDIAVALFGASRVAQDWYDPFDHLRDRVRRAIREGQRLMNGHYVKLLQ